MHWVYSQMLFWIYLVEEALRSHAYGSAGPNSPGNRCCTPAPPRPRSCQRSLRNGQYVRIVLVWCSRSACGPTLNFFNSYAASLAISHVSSSLTTSWPACVARPRRESTSYQHFKGSLPRIVLFELFRGWNWDQPGCRLIDPLIQISPVATLRLVPLTQSLVPTLLVLVSQHLTFPKNYKMALHQANKSKSNHTLPPPAKAIVTPLHPPKKT